MTTLTLNTPITQIPDLVATDMDGDTVMMSIERGEYFGIGGVGSRVWDLLAQPTTLAKITQAICAEYSVDEATCQADMQDFVAELIKNGLVSAG